MKWNAKTHTTQWKLWLALAAALFAGCGVIDRGPRSGSVTTLEDQGTVYLRAASSSPGLLGQCSVEPGQTRVEVVFDSCASSSCTTLTEASCTATRDGDEITVTSRAKIRRSAANAVCTNDCGILYTTCDVGELEEGTYTIVHGSQTTTVDVPGEDVPGCEVFGDDVETLENEGAVYLRSEGFDLNEAGRCSVDPGETRVEVVFDYCASSTCTTLTEAACTATRDGDEITVTSHAEIRRETGEAGCSDDCGILSAMCDLGAIEEGTYTILHGAQTTTVDVPVEETLCYTQ